MQLARLRQSSTWRDACYAPPLLQQRCGAGNRRFTVSAAAAAEAPPAEETFQYQAEVHTATINPHAVTR